MTRLTPDDWARAALKNLARGGLGAVAVEPLSRALGVTKGSFYWHFRNRNAVLEAALLLWEHNNTEAMADFERRFADPRKRLRALFAAAFEPWAFAPLLATLAAEADHPVIGPILARVTSARLAFLERVYQELGLAPDAATRQALLAYSAYVGLFQVLSTSDAHALEGEQLDAYVAHFVDVLVP